jgi:hypothetical protein
MSMPKILLFASALVATAGMWHAAHRLQAEPAHARGVQPTAGRTTCAYLGRSDAIAPASCPFLRVHPGLADGAVHRAAPSDATVCPFSGKSGRSSISLEDAMELHGVSPADDAPGQRREATWL